MTYLLNSFRNILYHINYNSLIFNKASRSIFNSYQEKFFLKKNIDMHRIKNKDDSNILLFNLLPMLQLDEKIFSKLFFSISDRNNPLNTRIDDDSMHKKYCKKKLFFLLHGKSIPLENRIKFNVHQLIKKNHGLFDIKNKKNIFSYSDNKKFSDKQLRTNKRLLSFISPFLKNLVSDIGFKKNILKNLKSSIENINLLLEGKCNLIDNAIIKKISFLSRETNNNNIVSRFGKNYFINLNNQFGLSFIINNCTLDSTSSLQLNSFYKNIFWKKAINYEVLTKIHNIEYVVDLKLYQEYLGMIFLKLKMNIKDKIAKFYITAKSNKIFSILKSSVSFLKYIFNKNSIKLSEISINNKNYVQYQEYKNKKQDFNNLAVLSMLKKENKELNSIIFFNKNNFQNMFLSSNRIDIYA